MWLLAYIGIFLISLFTPLWCFALLALCYALFRPGYGLLCIGVLIDAQFGSVHPGFAYAYTATAAGIVIGLELLKPYLSFYTERN